MKTKDRIVTKPRKLTDKEACALACHEAGHAVVTIALGLTITRVSIVQGEKHYGLCSGPSVLDYPAENRREQRSIVRDHIRSLFAGMHAEWLIDPDAPEFHGESDERHAFELSLKYEVYPRDCGRVGDDRHWAYLDRLSKESRRLVKKHWRAIEQFALVLLQRQEVGGAEAKQFIEPLLE
jgi:hypothetical protein